MTLKINDNILDALRIVQQECKMHEDCVGCPLIAADPEECILDSIPKDWQIKLRIVID